MSRFSQLYIERGSRTADSVRARKRLSAVLSSLLTAVDVQQAVGDRIIQEQGCDVPSFYGYDFEKFFTTAQIRDVLDAVTTTAKVFAEHGLRSFAQRWIS